MDCAEVRELFRGFLDSRLTHFQSALLLEHCDRCAECRRELVRLQAPQASSRRFDARRMRAPLGAAGLLLIACLAVYIFRLTPSPIPASPPNLPRATPHPEVGPPPGAIVHMPEAETARVIDQNPRPKSERKSSAHPAATANPAIDAYAGGEARSSAVGQGKSDAEESVREGSTLEDGDFTDKNGNSATAAKEAGDEPPEEKSSDGSDLSFRSEAPPYFFLYRPSMKPL